MAAIHVTKDDFQKVVLESETPVLVDFFAQWCGPCKEMAPLIDELSDELSGVKVCKLDIDSAMEIARQYRVMSIPTFIKFENGEAVKRTVGGQSKEDILDFLA